ncbi:hypothetical protein J4208_00495 [Candidatus Woesearchaeota archaeon]|nr:hypothetical protein [Candidatus Woesearchaeota archaeon]
MLKRSIFSVLFLFLIAGCNSVPSEPSSETNVNTSSNNLTPENITLPTTYPSSPNPVDEEKRQYLLARGAGIFNFSELTAATCDATITEYRELLDQTEDDLDEIGQELLEEERDLQKVKSDLQTALQNGNERAADRARDDIDDEQEDVDYVEDLLEEKNEYFRKIKLIFSTLREECVLLKARA